jgi:hypothetical protein
MKRNYSLNNIIHDYINVYVLRVSLNLLVIILFNTIFFIRVWQGVGVEGVAPLEKFSGKKSSRGTEVKINPRLNFEMFSVGPPGTRYLAEPCSLYKF